MKPPGREADHSPPPSTEVKNQWSDTSTTPVCLRGVYRDKFTFQCYYKFQFPIQNLVCRKKRKEHPKYAACTEVFKIAYLETTAERTHQICYALITVLNFLYAAVLPSEPDLSSSPLSITITRCFTLLASTFGSVLSNKIGLSFSLSTKDCLQAVCKVQPYVYRPGQAPRVPGG